MVLTGSQKALCPSARIGTWRRVGAHDRARQNSPGTWRIPRCRGAPHRGRKNSSPTNTPAISLLFALNEQLKRIEAAGGVEARWDVHKAMLNRVERLDRRCRWQTWSGVPADDLTGGAGPFRVLNVPDGLNGRTIARSMGDGGWVIGSGYGDLKESTIRLGHMGDHTVQELDNLLDALGGMLLVKYVVVVADSMDETGLDELRAAGNFEGRIHGKGSRPFTGVNSNGPTRCW